MVVLRMERWKMGCKCRKYLREIRTIIKYLFDRGKIGHVS